MNKKESKQTAVIAGAGQMGRAAAELLSSNNVELLAFADNSEKAWGKMILGAQVMPAQQALALGPDVDPGMANLRKASPKETVHKTAISEQIATVLVAVKEITEIFPTHQSKW